MRRVRIYSISLVAVYVMMFFLSAPIYMASIDLKVSIYWIPKIIGGYDFYANGWITKNLSESNPLTIARRENAFFWCKQFESCSLKPPNS